MHFAHSAEWYRFVNFCFWGSLLCSTVARKKHEMLFNTKILFPFIFAPTAEIEINSPYSVFSSFWDHITLNSSFFSVYFSCSCGGWTIIKNGRTWNLCFSIIFMNMTFFIAIFMAWDLSENSFAHFWTDMIVKCMVNNESNHFFSCFLFWESVFVPSRYIPYAICVNMKPLYYVTNHTWESRVLCGCLFIYDRADWFSCHWMTLIL